MTERHIELPEGASPRRKYVHELIAEYRRVLERADYAFPKDTDAIVILSGPTLDNTDNPESVRSPENIARIAFGKIGLDQLAALKSGKEESLLTEDDLSDPNLPLLVINAPTGQLETLGEVAVEAGVPLSRIHKQDCLPRERANTSTQFQAFLADSAVAGCKHPVFISHSYHEPRVARTADKSLPADLNYEIVGVPFEKGQFDVYRKIRGEIQRIVKYSAQEKNSISKYPRSSDLSEHKE